MNKKSVLFILMGVLFCFGTICFSSCNNDEDDEDDNNNTNNNTTTEITIESVTQFDGIISGQSVSYITGNLYMEMCSGGGSTDVGYSEKCYGSSIVPFSEPDSCLIGISIGTLISDSHKPSDAEFAAFFTLGEKAFSIDALEGIEINLIDSAGLRWSTSFGSTDQTGSHFEFDELLNVESIYDYMVKFKCSFNCKLYNDENSDIKTIEDATYVGYFQNM